MQELIITWKHTHYLATKNNTLKHKEMKVLNNIMYLLATVIITLTTVSCEKEINTNNETSENSSVDRSQRLTFQELDALLSQPSSPGSVLIESNDNIITQEGTRTAWFSEQATVSTDSKNEGTYVSKIHLYDENGIEINKQQWIEDSKTSPNSNKTTSNPVLEVFGKELNYEIESVDSKISSGSTIYIPELLKVRISSNTIKPGTIITWNADTSNESGIAIWATYSPLTQDDLNVALENLNEITQGITIEDAVGSYTITDSDLERFPNNSLVTINVARGNTSAILGEASTAATITAITQVSTISGISY